MIIVSLALVTPLLYFKKLHVYTNARSLVEVKTEGVLVLEKTNDDTTAKILKTFTQAGGMLPATALTNVDLPTESDDYNNAEYKSEPSLPPELSQTELEETEKTWEEVRQKTTEPLKACGGNLLGEMVIQKNVTREYEDLDKLIDPDSLQGGCYTPKNCKPRENVAIILPYKDREEHLKKLLYYLHPMLMRQGLKYCIYIAEQLDEGQFNKAMIMNAAFEEAMKLDDYDCIIFNDVDMIPENDRNFYTCDNSPTHFSPAIDKFEYKPDYGTIFGGVVGITPDQYRKANGHSNRFWGWGGEDNDMEFRIANAGMKITPKPLNIGKYQMIHHAHSAKFSANSRDHIRLEKSQKKRAEVDGLSDLEYSLHHVEKYRHFYKLMIDIRRIRVDRISVFINGKKQETFSSEIAPCYWETFEGKNLDAVMKTPKNESSFLTQHRATEACVQNSPPCNGVVKLNVLGEEVYELRQGFVPYNLVLTTSVPSYHRNNHTNRAERVLTKRYLYPPRISYLYNCPGHMGSMRAYRDVLQMQPNHTNIYRFEVHLTKLRNFSADLFYVDHIMIENKEQLDKRSPQQFKYFQGELLNFASSHTKFSFSTRFQEIPSIPGSYIVQSKLIDQFRQPYFQWNWWIETTTGDRDEDNRRREEFYKKQQEKRNEQLKQLRAEEIKRKEKLDLLVKQMAEQKKIAVAFKHQHDMENQIKLMHMQELQKKEAQP